MSLSPILMAASFATVSMGFAADADRGVVLDANIVVSLMLFARYLKPGGSKLAKFTSASDVVGFFDVAVDDLRIGALVVRGENFRITTGTLVVVTSGFGSFNSCKCASFSLTVDNLCVFDAIVSSGWAVVCGTFSSDDSVDSPSISVDDGSVSYGFTKSSSLCVSSAA